MQAIWPALSPYLRAIAVGVSATYRTTASTRSCVTRQSWSGFMGKSVDTPGAMVERKAATENKWDHVGGSHNPSNSADAAHARVEGRRFGEWCETWARECLRVLKPGGHIVAFSGTPDLSSSCRCDRGCGIRDQGIASTGTTLQASRKVISVPKAIGTQAASRIVSGRRTCDANAMGDDYEPSGRGRVNYDHWRRLRS